MFTEDQAAIMNFVAFELFSNGQSVCSEEQSPAVLTSICEQDFCVKNCPTEVQSQILISERYCQSSDLLPFPNPLDYGLLVDDISDLDFIWSLNDYLDNGGIAMADSFSLVTTPCSVNNTRYYLNINCETNPFTPSLNGGSFEVIVYPGPPENFADVVFISGENTCDLPDVQIIAGCEDYFKILPDAENPNSPITQGYSGNASYLIEFTPNPNGPDCRLIKTSDDGDILMNGDFENSVRYWTEIEELPPGTVNPNPFGIICVSQGFLNGTCDAWFGGWGSPSLTKVTQDIQIPASCDSLLLSFDYGLANCAEGSDIILDVLINDISIANINCSYPSEGLFGPINISSLDLPVGPASFMLSALETGFSGQSLFVDNISLVAKECFIELKASEIIEASYACTEADCTPLLPPICGGYDLISLDGSENAISDINNSDIKLAEAAISIQQTFNGRSKQDENEINNSQTSGDVGIRLGVKNAKTRRNSMVTSFLFSQPVCGQTIQLWDIDEQDALILTGYKDGIVVEYSISQLGSCLKINEGLFTPLNESCEIQVNQDPAFALSINFETCIDKIDIEFYDQTSNDGGSYTLVVKDGCTNECKGPQLGQLNGSNSAIADLNEASLHVANATMSIDNVFNGSSSQDENEINHSQTNGDIGIRLGSFNSVGIENSMQTHLNFSPSVCDFSLAIWDIDETDEIQVEGFNKGQPVNYSVAKIGSCLTNEDLRFFPSNVECQNQVSGDPTHMFIVYFESCIDKIVTSFYDQGADSGGSFTMVPGSACPPPLKRPDSGTLNAVRPNQCFDPEGNILSASQSNLPVIPENYEIVYILSYSDNYIIRDYGIEANFIVDSPGEYTIHTLVAELSDQSNPAYIALETLQMDSSSILDVYDQIDQGGGDICASLLVTGANFTISEINLGELMPLQDKFCFLNEQSTEIAAGYSVQPVFPESYEIAYMLVTGLNGIQEISDTPNFSIDTLSFYTIHNFIGEFSESTDDNFFDLESIVLKETTIDDINFDINSPDNPICAAIDLTGTKLDFNLPQAHDMVSNNSHICFDNETYVFTANRSGGRNIPPDFEEIYILVSLPDLIIYQINQSPTFPIEHPGNYAIYHMVAELSDNTDPNYIDIDQIINLNDAFTLLFQGGGDRCGHIGESNATVSIPNPQSGSIISETTELCLTNGIAFVNFQSDLNYQIPAGYQLFYLLVNADDIITSISINSIFQVFSAGKYKVHSMVANLDDQTSIGYIDPIGILDGQTNIQDVCLTLSTCNGDICASIDTIGLSFNVAAECCPSNLVVNDVPISADMYSSSISITSSGLINVGPVEFSSGEYIQLTAGFEVETGAVFHAVMEGCK